MDIGDLRNTVPDRHRKSREEKEWLTRLVMNKVKDDEGVEDEAGESARPHSRIERHHQRRRPQGKQGWPASQDPFRPPTFV